MSRPSDGNKSRKEQLYSTSRRERKKQDRKRALDGHRGGNHQKRMTMGSTADQIRQGRSFGNTANALFR